MLALASLVPTTTAHPPTKPEHGFNETTYCSLWAGDVDAPNITVFETRTANTSTGICGLAAGTDIPLDEPPKAVEQWNRMDLRDFPETDASRSIHPSDVELREGVFIKDAYTAVFAVQPSTRARVSPEMQPLYVARNGTVLGTTDYRIAVPQDEEDGSSRVEWELVRHDIVETRLLIDDTVVSTNSGSHTHAHAYELEGLGGQPHTLTLESDIVVGFQKQTAVCTQSNNSECLRWSSSVAYPTETVTVRDRVAVVAYDLEVSGFTARYPDGDLGLVVYKNQPWLGYSLPNGEVRGVWRFYAARDSGWDTLVTSTAGRTTTQHSPVHPLQVNAYPIESGPTVSSSQNLTLLEVAGRETQPPALPANVELDSLTTPYTASFSIATRAETAVFGIEDVTAAGLVQGVQAPADPDSFSSIQIHLSNLSLQALDVTDETVTVRVTLRDQQTGEPINTTGREGFIVLQDQRINTSGDGTVTRTIARPVGGVSARYEPGRWWFSTPGYVGDSDIVYPRGTVLQLLSSLYQLAIPIAVFLFGVFIVDRITGWRVWPPWRWL